MSPRPTSELALFATLFTFASSVAFSQQEREYGIPAENLRCLAENRQRYLDVPRAIIFLTPSSCPAVGNEDVATLSLNSGSESAETERLVLTKADFACLADKIEDFLDENDPAALGQERVAFLVDCP